MSASSPANQHAHSSFSKLTLSSYHPKTNSPENSPTHQQRQHQKGNKLRSHYPLYSKESSANAPMSPSSSNQDMNNGATSRRSSLRSNLLLHDESPYFNLNSLTRVECQTASTAASGGGVSGSDDHFNTLGPNSSSFQQQQYYNSNATNNGGHLLRQGNQNIKASQHASMSPGNASLAPFRRYRNSTADNNGKRQDFMPSGDAAGNGVTRIHPIGKRPFTDAPHASRKFNRKKIYHGLSSAQKLPPSQNNAAGNSTKKRKKKRKNQDASKYAKAPNHLLGTLKKRPSDVGSIGPFRDTSAQGRSSVASPLMQHQNSLFSLYGNSDFNPAPRSPLSEHSNADNINRVTTRLSPSSPSTRAKSSLTSNFHPPSSAPSGVGPLRSKYYDENEDYEESYGEDYDSYSDDYELTPRETLEQMKQRESQAWRRMNQSMLQEKKRKDMLEREQKRQQILMEKRERRQKRQKRQQTAFQKPKQQRRDDSSAHRQPVPPQTAPHGASRRNRSYSHSSAPFIPSKSQLTENQIEPESRHHAAQIPRPASTPATGVTNRISAHMHNIRRKSLQRKSISKDQLPASESRPYSGHSQASHGASRPRTGRSRPTSSYLLPLSDWNQTSGENDEASLYSEVPEEFGMYNGEDDFAPVTPLSSRPISAKTTYNPHSAKLGRKPAVVQQQKKRIYSEYPAPIRYHPEVYRKEKEEVQLMKQIRQLHSAENNSKKAFSVRLNKIRGKEAKIKWEHTREAYFQQAREEKLRVQQSLEEKRRQEEEEQQKVRARIRKQKQMKKKWKKERDYFVQFSCRHNMISKQLTTSKIKSKQEENQEQLRSTVNRRKKENERRKDFLQNIMFKELNRKRAMVTFTNYQTKKELEKLAQTQQQKQKAKVRKVRQWENNKKNKTSELYADYSVMSKKRKSLDQRRLEEDEGHPEGSIDEDASPADQRRDASPFSIVSPKSSRPNSTLQRRSRRPKSAHPVYREKNSARGAHPFLSVVNHVDDEFDFDTATLGGRPSSAHAPLKVNEEDI